MSESKSWFCGATVEPYCNYSHGRSTTSDLASVHDNSRATQCKGMM